MSLKQFLSPERWAVLVLREIRDGRREVRHALATQQEQIAQLTQQQSEMLDILSVLGGDVQQLLDKQSSLMQQLQTLNTQIPQDLSPLISTQQHVLDGLSGLKNKLEAAATPVTPPPVAEPAPAAPETDPTTTPPTV